MKQKRVLPLIWPGLFFQFATSPQTRLKVSVTKGMTIQTLSFCSLFSNIVKSCSDCLIFIIILKNTNGCCKLPCQAIDLNELQSVRWHKCHNKWLGWHCPFVQVITRLGVQFGNQELTISEFPKGDLTWNMKPRLRVSWHSQRSGNIRQANQCRSYDNYFHFSNCANSPLASTSCRSLVTFQELWKGLFCTLLTVVTSNIYMRFSDCYWQTSHHINVASNMRWFVCKTLQPLACFCNGFFL